MFRHFTIRHILLIFQALLYSFVPHIIYILYLSGMDVWDWKSLSDGLLRTLLCDAGKVFMDVKLIVTTTDTDSCKQKKGPELRQGWLEHCRRLWQCRRSRESARARVAKSRESILLPLFLLRGSFYMSIAHLSFLAQIFPHICSKPFSITEIIGAQTLVQMTSPDVLLQTVISLIS